MRLAGGPTGPGRAVGGRLEHLDWLLLAVTPTVEDAEQASHFVEHISTARERGEITGGRLALVTTGDESTTEIGDDIVSALVGMPVVTRIPQLWGRSEPNLGFGAALAIGDLDDAVFELWSTLSSWSRASSRGHALQFARAHCVHTR